MVDNRPVLFLDIDGVLNNHTTFNKSPNGFTGVQDKFLRRLYTIASVTGAKIVLISDWKDLWKEDDNFTTCKDLDAQYLINRLQEFDLQIEDMTKDKSKSTNALSGRGNGIREYIAEHNVELYAILDDFTFSDYTDELLAHIIKPKCGLSEGDIEDAVALLE